MDEGTSRGDSSGSFIRQSSLRQGNGYKSVLSGKSSPRSPHTFRRLYSSRTPRREGIFGSIGGQWFRSNKLAYWLLLITLWTYLGFYVQSRWAHEDDTNRFLGFRHKRSISKSDSLSVAADRRNLIANDSSMVVKNEIDVLLVKDKSIGVVLGTQGNKNSDSPPRNLVQKQNKKPPRKPRGKTRSQHTSKAKVQSADLEEHEQEILKRNSSYGLLVGPFGETEDRLLELTHDNGSGTCDRKGDFSRLVRSRKFLLIFHELSMTGAPLSMMELASELVNCGATVSAVVLSKKGGLMSELSRRRIKVLEDRTTLSYKVGMRSDLVIAGSAVCASWIDQYIEHFPAGGNQIAWWIMENREEYFHRAKIALDQVKIIIFLSESQSKQWLAWCEQEKIKLRLPPSIVPLSVNDELAFVAGISCSLNSPSFTPERMLERRKLLRDAVREEMGLVENDILLVTLSSINRGKGQLRLLESLHLVMGNASSQPDIGSHVSAGLDLNRTNSTDGYRSRALLHGPNDQNLASGLDSRKILSSSRAMDKHALKVLIGSVGSKSNKLPYVREILLFLSQHPMLSRSVLWTPSTTRVASLYSAADVYVINSQGIGETFGRVTIEAMAFGLPVLGTDAGGTKEIVEHNKTGLLHPIGQPGNEILAHNIKLLLEDPSMREQMGTEGRKTVEASYLKRHMYEKLAAVLSKCMR
ncbi:hypothetical protein MLD38_030185 [Melastoma candidum]|uniref:Uncharacterized protein n=1 Tax=Melastoma candidum TaxID=119954 RepID=A0ACB9MKW9_9MYRT|nr:hypothetical protein MLD38_030185 [Melastoma candidum]